MDIDLAERARVEKWKQHRQSDERDEMLKDIEISKEDEMKVLEFLRKRQESNKTIKKEYIEVILDFMQQEKQSKKLKRIDLIER